MDATTIYIDACIKSVSKDTPSEEVKALKHEIEQVIAQNPTHFLRNRWEQGIFTLLINADDTEGLVHYAQRVKPSSLEMQIAVLNAELQLERTKNETNKKQNSNSDSNIISRYEQLWLTNGKLPNDAQLWANGIPMANGHKIKSTKKPRNSLPKMMRTGWRCYHRN